MLVGTLLELIRKILIKSFAELTMLSIFANEMFPCSYIIYFVQTRLVLEGTYKCDSSKKVSKYL